MIPVSKPSMGKEESVAVEKVFSTGWLGLGSVVFDFENKIREYLGAKHVIAVNTGTSALHIALDSYGITAGDEVLVPSLTFVATIQAIIQTGATPVFCDIKTQDLNIDIDDVREKITHKTKAIMPVHYCGKPCDMDSLLELGKKHKLKIIEDAAHAFASLYKGKKIGSFGDATCFSFDPIKIITCGEGGAVALEDDDLVEKLRRKRILGIDKDTWHRYQNKRSWSYEVTDSGYRYHMSNINAAIGIEQMNKIDKFIEKRRKITLVYDREFNGLKGIQLLENDHKNVAQFCYIAKFKNRDKAMSFLKEKGVETGVHYIPNHWHPLFKKYARKLPRTEEVSEEILTLPLYFDMTESDIELVINSVKEFLNGPKG